MTRQLFRLKFLLIGFFITEFYDYLNSFFIDQLVKATPDTYNFVNLLYCFGVVALCLICLFIDYHYGFFEKTFSRPIKNLSIVLCIALSVIAASIAVLIFYYKFVTKVPPGNSKGLVDLQFVFLPFTEFLLLNVEAPIVEETVFRGLLFSAIKNDKISVILSSLLFAYMHTGISVSYFVYLPLAFGFSLAYARRKNLADSMLVHSLYNTFASQVFQWFISLTGILR